MMYKKIYKTNNVSSRIVFLEDRIFFTGTLLKSIEAWSLEATIQYWVADFPGHICKKFNNEIFTSNLYFYNIYGEILFKNNSDILYTFELQYKNRSIWKTINSSLSEVKYHIFDLEKKEFLSKDISLNKRGIPKLFKDDFIVFVNSEEELKCFDFLKNEIVWQHDFTEACRFIDYDKIDRDENERLPGQIEDIVLYGEDKIIVSFKYSKVFCIELFTGKIVWENDYSSGREYVIVGDIGYAYSNGGSINKIDLKTGESLHKDKRFHSLPEIPYYKGIHISTVTNEMVYFNNLLWSRIYSNGYSFVVAIHPDTYQYEWIHRVETTEKVMSIQFYNDRMYLRTSGSDWFIYEKH